MDEIIHKTPRPKPFWGKRKRGSVSHYVVQSNDTDAVNIVCGRNFYILRTRDFKHDEDGRKCKHCCRILSLLPRGAFNG